MITPNPTYSPLPHIPATAGTHLAPMRRHVRYAETHPVQPLKGLRETRTASVSYRASVPAGQGGRGATLSYRASSPGGETWSFPIEGNLSVTPTIVHCSFYIVHCFTFSAKERDPETGYSYFGSRYYSSDLSVWLSVDPQAAKYPSLSPYTYCANNPVRLVDPNGEDWYIPESGASPMYDENVTQDNLPEGAQYVGKTAHWFGQTESDNQYYYHGDAEGNVTKQDMTVTITPRSGGYDVDKAVEYLQNHAEPASTSKCARYTVNAINKGGGGNVRMADAYLMGPNLEKGGFVKMNIDYSEALKGDVAVFQPFYKSQNPGLKLNKDHPYGHMQMFDGKNWISDFKQSDFWAGSDYRCAKPKYQIYRYSK